MRKKIVHWTLATGIQIRYMLPIRLYVPQSISFLRRDPLAEDAVARWRDGCTSIPPAKLVATPECLPYMREAFLRTFKEILITRQRGRIG